MKLHLWTKRLLLIMLEEIGAEFELHKSAFGWHPKKTRKCKTSMQLMEEFLLWQMKIGILRELFCIRSGRIEKNFLP